MRLPAFFALVAVAVGMPAAAHAQGQAPAQPQQAQRPVAGDPNEVICEKQEVIGSRIATKRICLKRWEWAERKHLDRQDVEKAQTQIGIRGE